MPDTRPMYNPGKYRVLLVLPDDEVERKDTLENITDALDSLDAAGVGDEVTLNDAVLLEAPNENVFTIMTAELISRLGVDIAD